MSEIAPQQKSYKKILGILLTSSLLDYVGTGIMLPLLPFYAQFLGASAFEVGLIFGIYFLTGVLAPPLWGSLSDRIGRRPALLLNIAGTTFYYLWLTVANSLWMLVAARMLGGASSSSIAIAQSYVSDLTDSDNRTKTFGWLQMACAVGLVTGPVVAGLLLGDDPITPNFRLPSLVAAVASGLTLSVAFFALPQGHHSIQLVKTKIPLTPQQYLTNLKKILTRPLIGILVIVAFVGMVGGTGIQAIFALWCEKRFGWGTQQFCYIMIYYCIGIVLIQGGGLGKLSKWLGDIRLLLISLGLGILGAFLLPFSTTIPQILGSLIFLIATEALFYPARASLASKLAGAQQQGETLGLMHSVSGLSRFSGAILAGFLFSAFGENWPLWVGALLMAIAALLCWQYVTPARFSMTIDRRRRYKLIHLFEIFDRDKNGTIDMKDFYQTCQDLAQIRNWPSHTNEYKVLETTLTGFGKRLIEEADLDDDQKINQAEWIDYLQKCIDIDFASFFFEIIDINNDEQVAIEELDLFYQAYDISIEDLEAIFHTLDLNQDGRISKTEFEDIFAQFLHSDDIQAPGNWIFGSNLPLSL